MSLARDFLDHLLAETTWSPGELARLAAVGITEAQIRAARAGGAGAAQASNQEGGRVNDALALPDPTTATIAAMHDGCRRIEMWMTETDDLADALAELNPPALPPGDPADKEDAP